MVTSNSVEQVRKRIVGRRLINELRQFLNRLLPRALARHRGRKHLPIIFGVAVTRVERDAVLVAYRRVERGLHVVDPLRDKVGLKLAVGIEVVEEAVGVICAVVEGCVRGVGVVRNTEVLPLRDVALGGGGVVCAVCGVAGEVCDDGHGLDADHALQSQIGLVGKGAGEVVGGDLVGRVEGVLDEVGGPLLEDLVVLGEVGSVLLALGVGEGHDEHVAALFQRLLFVIAEGVARGVGVVAAEVVHGVRVGVLTGFLVLEEWVEEKFQEPWVAVKQNGMEGKDDIDSLDISVGTDLLEEEVCLGGSSDKLSGTECLASCKGSDGEVVLASSSDSVGLELAVKV